MSASAQALPHACIRTEYPDTNATNAQTGIPVRLVAIDENQFSQMIMSVAAAGRPPDVIGALPLTATWQLAGNELLDTCSRPSCWPCRCSCCSPNSACAAR